MMAQAEEGYKAPKLRGLYIVTRAFAGGGVVASEGQIVKNPPVVYKPFSRKATKAEAEAWKLLQS